MTVRAVAGDAALLAAGALSVGLAPVHAPLNPVKVPPPVAVAFSVTALPDAKLDWQVPLATPEVTVQLIPAGVLVTVPEPVPEPVTVSLGCNPKFATRLRLALAVKL